MPERDSATSIVSGPALPSTRATSAPQRMSSASVLVRCERPHGQQDDRLEQARLAGRIRPDDEVGPAAEDQVGRAVAPEILDGDRVEQRRVPYEVVRSGMTTWT